MGAAGTRMPATRVPRYSCGTVFSGWLDGAHPTVEDGEVFRIVCFSRRPTGCRSYASISVSILNGLNINNQGKITTTRKCSGKCMKPELSEAKTKQSMKTGFNFTSQRSSDKWRNLM